jgi:hypothetical protein
MAYVFDPEVLAKVVQKHVNLPVEKQVEAVSSTLKNVYGEHVHPGQPWMWSTAGGIMCAISVLHVSLDEYLLFCGTAIGSEGHSGRHRAQIYDVVMAGELWTYPAGGIDRKGYTPGQLACLERGTANGSKLRPGTWLLEYARGNIPSLFPFALGDTLFSTLDTTDLVHQLGISAKLMLREARTYVQARRWQKPFEPNLAALTRSEGNGARKSNGHVGITG